MDYISFIKSIIENRGRFACDGYHERHHIKPKCLGGTNDQQNLIDLYPKEHWMAHKLLAEENPNIAPLVFAFWMMCNISNNLQSRYICTAEEYENARKMAIELRSGTYGDEIRNKISQAMKGVNHPNYGRKWSDTAIKNMKDGHKKNPVKCIETDVEYESQAEASRVMNLDKSHIGRSAKSNGRLSVKGFHFIYV